MLWCQCLPEQLRSSLKRTMNWNKYNSKVSTEMQNQYLDLFIISSFQGLFVLLFENEEDR